MEGHSTKPLMGTTRKCEGPEKQRKTGERDRLEVAKEKWKPNAMWSPGLENVSWKTRNLAKACSLHNNIVPSS